MITLTNFTKNNIPLSWKTVWVGRRLKLIDNSFIEDFASQYLFEHYKLDNINIIELAYGIKDNFEVDQNLQGIFEWLCININEGSEEWVTETKKLRFLLLQTLLNKNFNNKRILDEIESIYCDFEHPEELAEFITYMPHMYDDGYNVKDHSVEENRAHIVRRFKNFLLREYEEILKLSK